MRQLPSIGYKTVRHKITSCISKKSFDTFHFVLFFCFFFVFRTVFKNAVGFRITFLLVDSLYRRAQSYRFQFDGETQQQHLQSRSHGVFFFFLFFLTGIYRTTSIDNTHNLETRVKVLHVATSNSSRIFINWHRVTREF